MVVIKNKNSLDLNKKEVEKQIEVEEKKETNAITKKEPDEKYKIYNELMDIRLNNILAEADKESLKEYLEFKNHLEEQLDNLDDRKYFNLLSDCTIKAGSKDGIIITASNINILNELFEDLFNLENFFINKLCYELFLKE